MPILSPVWQFVLAPWQVSAVLYVYELSGVSTVDRRTIPRGDRDLGVTGIRAPLARKIAAHVRTPGQDATAIPGLTLYRLLGGLTLTTGTGEELRSPGITIVGGLLLSQLLTPYTTPVVSFRLDRLAQSFAPHRIGNPIPQEGMTD